ncbi:MAG TPA: class I SAM-dependent methyltransferase [Nitrospiraceae bacterium]
MIRDAGLWDSGERVPAESHNTLYLELLSAYEAAKNLIGEGTILDIGCGAGYGSDRLAGAGRLVIGIDYEPAVARAAAGQYRRSGLSFACMDGARLAIRRQSADLICAFQVIEHLSDQALFVRDVAATLRPTGIAILSTPNALVHRGPRNPFHLHEFTPDELHALLARHFAHVRLAGQTRPAEIYSLEAACRRVRGWDVLGIKRLVPRRLVSSIVSAVARWNGLTPPQQMPLSRFAISADTAHAYSLFALCSHAPFDTERVSVVGI